MPHAEVEAYAALYAQSHLINQENSAYGVAMNDLSEAYPDFSPGSLGYLFISQGNHRVDA
jgi:hypothetical protein